MDKIYTSEEILMLIENKDHYRFFEDISCLGKALKYQLTEDEIEWYKFVSGRYDIADYLYNNTDENFVLTINDSGLDLSEALKNDDCNDGKAVCLSDNSALQAIFFNLFHRD